MVGAIFRWLPLAVIIAVALWLRTRALSSRPMHADEANQAVKLGELIETGRYAFDPKDHHGPTLYYAALPVAWLRGQKTLGALTETTVRLVPALAGTLGVLLLAWFAHPLGRWPAFFAAALMAVSPPSVYYSRDFIQETLLVAFALATLVCVQRWWRTGRMRWAVASGICAGLMQSTKETAPLFIAAAAVAWLVVGARPPASRRGGRDGLVAAIAALITMAALYSSFGTHLSGLNDAFKALGFGARKAAMGGGHEKPWWYYVHLFGWLRRDGLVFQQLGLLALALCGAGLALMRFPRRAAVAKDLPELTDDLSGEENQTGQDRARFLRGVAVYTAVIAIALSVVPYKTPWHAVHLVPGFAVLAAGALAAFPRAGVSGLIAAIVLFMQGSQTQLAVFQRPADPRNPYAYVQSSPDVLKFRGLAIAALAGRPDGPIRVIGEEYWPLPWYLRGLGRTGYWSTPPTDCDGALVIATATQADAVRARLHGKYRESLLGLRPGVLCVVFTPLP